MVKPMSDISTKFFENAKSHILEDERRIDRNTKDLMSVYEKAVMQTEDRIHAIYSKFASENGMTVQEARKYITESEQNVFRKSVSEYLKDISLEGEESKTLVELNTLSAKARLTREEKLLADIYMDMGRMADRTGDELEAVLKDTLRTTFLRSSLDIQNAMGVYYRINMLSDAAISKIVNHPWSGKRFSQRIWGHVDNLNAHVKEVLTDGFVQGKSIDKMVRGLRERTGVAGEAVERLIRTETKYFANQGELEGYKANGITKYVYLGTREQHFACNCASLNGTIIDVDDAKPFENFPPLHPNCKCSVRAYFENSILDNNKGAVPYDKKLSLPEWKHRYVIKHEEDLVKGLKDVLKCDIIKAQRTPHMVSPGLANKASYIINNRGQISLSLYDENGRIKKQFHNSNHDLPKFHDFGLLGEHVHDWDYEAYQEEIKAYRKNKAGKRPTPARKPRECNAEERKIMEKLL